MADYDLIVVGGGPSGASAAITAVKRGLKVLLLEQGGRNRIKPCGGLLTMAAHDAVKDVFGTDVPNDVLSEPRYLDTFYIPPSGITNGGIVEGEILNLNRAHFDEWLRNKAESEGVHVSYNSKLVDFNAKSSVKAKIYCSNGVAKYLTALYLIGADGVYSGVKTQLY